MEKEIKVKLLNSNKKNYKLELKSFWASGVKSTSIWRVLITNLSTNISLEKVYFIQKQNKYSYNIIDLTSKELENLF